MIKVSVLYPYSQGARFDMTYYCEKHMPMVRSKLGAACKGMFVEQGIGGSEPGTPPLFVAMGHLLFDSIEAFHSSFGVNATEILGDIPNYTPIQPKIQISEVKDIAGD